MIIGNRKKEVTLLRQKIETLENQNKALEEMLLGEGTGKDPKYNISLYAKALEILGAGYWLSAPDYTQIWLSPVAREILGAKEEQIQLEAFKNMILPEDRVSFDRIFQETIHSAKTMELEIKVARLENDGREFRVLTLKMLKLADNKTAAMPNILGTMVDITRQDKNKRELTRARDRAEDSEKLKNILLANISHEIRTPMNSIIGFSELLNIGNLAFDKRLDYVKTIKNQGARLLKLIDDIAELTKIEAGKITINKSPCNIDLLLNEMVVYFNQQKLLQNKGHLEIRLNFPESRGIVIYTDPGRLQQLITNLMSNSIKFTEKGFIEIGYKPVSDDKVEFYIKDSGIGLTRDQQKNIFNRFAEEETIAGKYEGSGLGLTISKNLAKLLGGKIWVESEPGKGATFFFTIPFETVPETYHQFPIEEEFEIPRFNWKDKVILVVEDDDVNYKFLEAILHETDAQLIHAINGFQAVELCRSINKIDLVLMDIKMPEMDGFEATRQIRSFNKKIPIIAQTAFALENDRDKCLEAGCNDHITKPIEIKEFFEKVDTFLRET